MALGLTAREMVDVLSSANDKSLIFQQIAYGDNTLAATVADNSDAQPSVNSGGELLKFQPLVLDADVTAEATKIPIGYKTGRASMTKSAPGSVDLTNGINILASTEYGAEWLYRNITQDKAPTWKYRGKGSTNPKTVWTKWTPIAATTSLSTDGEVGTVVARVAANGTTVVQFDLTLAATASVDANSTAEIEISGTDYNGSAISETFTWVNSTSSARVLTTAELTRKTTNWYKTINKPKVKNFNAGTFSVSADDESVEVEFTPQDLILVDFFTLEYAYGGLVPYTYRDLMVSSFSCNMTRNSAVMFACQLLGGIVGIRENEDGGSTPTSTTSLSDLSRASTDVYNGGVVSIEVDGVEIPIRDATINFTSGFAYPDYNAPSLYQTGKPIRTDKRNISVNCTTLASTQNDLETLFFNNTTINDVKVKFVQAVPGTLGLYPAELEFSFPEMEITNNPALSSSGNSEIAPPLNLTAFNNDGNAEYTIVTRQPSYEQLYNYAA